MLKPNFLSIAHLACAIVSVFFLVNSSTVFGAVAVHSMHRTIGGYAAASTNGVTQTNMFGGSFTNRGWLRLNRTATATLTGSTDTSRASASASQDSTIAYSPSNFHFNATGGYLVSAESEGFAPASSFSATLATNRAVMFFTTDEDSVVRVRSTVVESEPGSTIITLRSGATAVLRADGLGIEQNGSAVATNGQVHRFTLAPGNYALELTCDGQAFSFGAARLRFDASYQFEFTAVNSRLIPADTPTFRYRPRLDRRRAGRQWSDPDYDYYQRVDQVIWPLSAVQFDLLESPVYPLPLWPPTPSPFSHSSNALESDGTNFVLSLPGVTSRDPKGAGPREVIRLSDASWLTNQMRLFQLRRLP